MKTLLLGLAILLCSSMINAQVSVNDYLGTWRGEKGDTIFTIKLLKGETLYQGKIIVLFGGYSVSVQGTLIDEYLNTNTHFDTKKSPIEQHITIDASYSTSYPQAIGFTFYDQRKKHFNGKGILGGSMEYIVPNKLHWTLNEKKGIWIKTEGREDWVEVKPIGFSVPTDIILTKIKE